MAVIHRILQKFRSLLWDFKDIQKGYDDEKPKKKKKHSKFFLGSSVIKIVSIE